MGLLEELRKQLEEMLGEDAPAPTRPRPAENRRPPEARPRTSEAQRPPEVPARRSEPPSRRLPPVQEAPEGGPPPVVVVREPTPWQPKASAGEEAAPSPVAWSAWIRQPQNLQRGVILTEILGPPRSRQGHRPGANPS